MATLAQRAATPVVPRLGVRYDAIVVATSLWMGAGLYWDGWAHGYRLPDSFWTIWHAAFYSGFAACAVAVLAPVVMAKPRSASWRAAIPAGYGYAVAGVLVFAAGGIFDAVWHTLFGIEFSTDALLSPSHLLLGTGASLIVSAPFVAARRRARTDLAGQLPAVLSLTLLLGVFTFFTLFAGPYSAVIGGGDRPSDTTLIRSMLGVYLFSALITGCALVALRRAALPPGALTIVVGLNGVAMILMRGHATLATQLTFSLVAIAAGAVGDVLVWRLRLRPSLDRTVALRIFSFAFPAAYWALYLMVVALGVGTRWTVHELAGIVFVSGAIGLLTSFVFSAGSAGEAA
ncbi:MAG TPA: hypothetical protein VI814_05810 [Candidatus Limnocylindria bacterium]